MSSERTEAIRAFIAEMHPEELKLAKLYVEIGLLEEESEWAAHQAHSETKRRQEVQLFGRLSGRPAAE